MVAITSLHTKLLTVLLCIGFAFNTTAIAQIAGSPGQKQAATEWRRADFQVTGAGCVLCIRRLTYVLQHSAGVREASVEIRKPHRATIIYDKRQTSPEKIFSQFKEDSILRSIKVEQLQDRPLSKSATGAKA